MGVVESQLNIITQEVIPAQSAYPYRLIGSLSLPIRLCVRLSPSSTLPSLYLSRVLVSGQAFEFRFRLCCLYSPLCPSLSLLSPLSLTLPPLLPPSLPPL